MRTYELMAVLAPDIPEEQMPGALERVGGYITGPGGEVTELVTTSPWGRRRLAYMIEKHRDGFYALYHFNLEPEGITDLERDLRLDNQVIRHLVTTFTAPKPKKLSKKERIAAEAAAAAGEDGATEDGATNADAADTTPIASAEPAIESASGATVDTDQPPASPTGEDTENPPTAETPETEDDTETEA